MIKRNERYFWSPNFDSGIRRRTEMPWVEEKHNGGGIPPTVNQESLAEDQTPDWDGVISLLIILRTRRKKSLPK